MKKTIKFFLGTLLLGTFGLASCSSLPVPGGHGGQSSDDFKVKSVTLSEEYRELQIDADFVLQAVVEFDDDYEGGKFFSKWSASSSLITIEENINSPYEVTITANRAGTAYVTYMAGLKKASCEIKVLEPANPDNPDPNPDPGPEPGPVEPSDFYIDLSVLERTLRPGESFKIIPTTSEPLGDNEIIEWTSSNTAVASVSNDGLVSALTVGETVIKATVRGESAECNVSVTNEGGGEVGKTINVYFFIDYNNVDSTGTDVTCYPLLANFKWYSDRPISESSEAQEQVLSKFKVNDPATDAMALDPAFPHFIGWSSHTIIDNMNDLWDMEKDVIGPSLSFIYFYGIWSD